MEWYEHCKKNLQYVSVNYTELENPAKKRYVSSIIWCLNNMTTDTVAFRNYIKPLRKELKENINIVIGFGIKEWCRGIMLCYCYYLYTILVKLMKKNYT